MVRASNIDLSHLFLNADAGLDEKAFRQHLESLFIEANIDLNKRNGFRTDREYYFDKKLYKTGSSSEHSFAWMDAYKGGLIRYEHLSAT